MTNEQARRANGARIESERRAIGTRMETERRAIGTNNEAARRGVTASSLKRDLNALETSNRKTAELRTIESVGARPATSGQAYWTPDKEPASTGGGIASPLTEKTRVEDDFTVPDRAFYTEVPLISSDGLFTYVVKPIKTLNFTDAESAVAVVELAAPSVPIP